MRCPPLTLAVSLLAMLLVSGCGDSSSQATTSSSQRDGEVGSSDQPDAPQTLGTTGTVTFVIHQGADDFTFNIDQVPQGATLESVMRQIDQIEVSIRGSGVTAFVDAIGRTVTTGSEGWTYTVDGQFANVGIGEMTVNPPATVEWSFGSMEAP